MQPNYASSVWDDIQEFFVNIGNDIKCIAVDCKKSTHKAQAEPQVEQLKYDPKLVQNVQRQQYVPIPDDDDVSTVMPPPMVEVTEHLKEVEVKGGNVSGCPKNNFQVEVKSSNDSDCLEHDCPETYPVAEDCLDSTTTVKPTENTTAGHPPNFSSTRLFDSSDREMGHVKQRKQSARVTESSVTSMVNTTVSSTTVASTVKVTTTVETTTLATPTATIPKPADDSSCELTEDSCEGLEILRGRRKNVDDIFPFFNKLIKNTSKGIEKLINKVMKQYT